MGYTGSIPDTAARRRDWTEDAACAGKKLDVFFERKHELEARTTCAVNCPVRAQCLADILSVEAGMSRDHRSGIFAGLDGTERWHLDATAPGHADDGSTLFTAAGPAPDCGTPEALLRHLALAEPVDDRCWSGHLRRTHSARHAGTALVVESPEPESQRKKRSGCGSEQAWYLHRRRKEKCRVCEQAHAEHILARRREVLAEEHLKGGSERGYMIHRRLGETPCAACREGAGRDRKARIVRESRYPKKGGLTAREQRVRELWAGNFSDAEIGRQVGVSRSGVANIRRRLGIQGPPPSPAPEPESEPEPVTVPEPERQLQTPHERRIHALWATGASDFEIARRMAVSAPAVQRVRERLGLMPRLHTEKAS